MVEAAFGVVEGLMVEGVVCDRWVLGNGMKVQKGLVKVCFWWRYKVRR